MMMGRRGWASVSIKQLASALIIVMGGCMLVTSAAGAGSDSAFIFRVQRRAAQRASVHSPLASQQKPSADQRTTKTVRVDSFRFQPQQFVPVDAVNDVQDKLLRAKEEQEKALLTVKAEYEQSAAAWDRKIREMADVLENQRSASNKQELELQAVREELSAKKTQIHALESSCTGLESQLNVTRTAMDDLESQRRETNLRIKELEYEVEYTEDQYSQEVRIVRMRDARIRDLEQGLVDAACVQSSMNTTITYLQARVAELETQVDDLNGRILQGRAAEERLRRELLAAADRHQSDMSALQEIKSELTSQLCDAGYRIKSLQDVVEVRDRTIAAQETAIAAADRSIATLQDERTKANAEYQSVEQQLQEINGDYYQNLSDMEIIKRDKAQNAARIEVLMMELQAERQLRVKEAEVWRTAVDVAENSRRAAEKTVEALDSRLRAIEDVERDRSVVLQERKEAARGRLGRVVRRSVLFLGLAGLGALPGVSWWVSTVNAALVTLETAYGGKFSPKGRLLRIVVGVVLAAGLAALGRNGRPMMEQGRGPEPPKWNASGFFFSPRS